MFQTRTRPVEDRKPFDPVQAKARIPEKQSVQRVQVVLGMLGATSLFQHSEALARRMVGESFTPSARRCAQEGGSCGIVIDPFFFMLGVLDRAVASAPGD